MHRLSAILAGSFLAASLALALPAHAEIQTDSSVPTTAPRIEKPVSSTERTITLFSSKNEVIATISLPKVSINGPQLVVNANNISVDHTQHTIAISGNVNIRLMENKKTLLDLNADKAIVTDPQMGEKNSPS